jgi:predicted MFS family arabinose efflux permease
VPSESGLPGRLVVLLAVAGGAAVANNYYVQPLLATLEHDFGVGPTEAGLLVTAGQLGYLAGLVLLVPLGDLVERRRLVCVLMTLSAVTLACCAGAPSTGLLAGALTMLGVTTVAAQVLVPLANDLAVPNQRGRVVSQVVSGFLIGILVARSFSGVVADLAGWRAVFAVVALITLTLMVCVQRSVPTTRPRASMGYVALLRSLGALVRDEPILRKRMVFGMLGMATFTVFWTTLTFLLSGPPFHYSSSIIGLIGITGVVGAAASQGAGRTFDRGGAGLALGGFWAVGVLAWGVCSLGSRNIVPILAGIVLLDAAIQGQHMLNQMTILGLRPEVRSRANTAYVVSVFVGAAAGSAAAAVVWSAGGWLAVCAFGGSLALAALVLWALVIGWS